VYLVKLYICVFFVSHQQWQDVDTQGATDAEFITVSDTRQLLCVANMRNNAGQTQVMSVVYGWDGERQQFVVVQYLATKGARAVHSLTVHNVTYVVFANSFDSELQAYET